VLADLGEAGQTLRMTKRLTSVNGRPAQLCTVTIFLINAGYFLPSPATQGLQPRSWLPEEGARKKFGFVNFYNKNIKNTSANIFRRHDS
jgi:hypothetical protein